MKTFERASESMSQTYSDINRQKKIAANAYTTTTTASTTTANVNNDATNNNK